MNRNWEAHREFYDGTGRTYYLHTGVHKQSHNLYSIVYQPWNKTLSFAVVSMDDHDVLRFTAENLDEAEEIVKHFKNEYGR